MDILYLIVARAGSKGVPNKNLRKIGSISLVGFKALSARKSRYCSRLVISSESAEIQADARGYGVEVPFARPAELATDTASTYDVVNHAIQFFETKERRRYDAIMLLEPSSPFARGEDYDGAVELMLKHDANLVVGVRETEVNSRFIGRLSGEGRITEIIDKMKGLKSVRRQEFEPEYTMNGALYLFGWDFFKRTKNYYSDRQKSYGYPMDRLHSFDIETMFELRLVEFLVESGQIDLADWR